MKRISQKDRVLSHMRDYGCISSWEAFTDYGIMRLSAVIFNLKKEGHNITSETINTKNRYGHPTHYSRYSLVK